MPTFFPYILSYGKGNSARLRNKMKKQISKDNKRSVIPANVLCNQTIGKSLLIIFSI